MSHRIKDLCRLCASEHEYSKDLLDKNNKSIADLMRQFTQITVIECENMPTRLCLDCEEKLVSFQLFILECYKVQDSLRQMCLEESSLAIKQEVKPHIALVKAEVTDELLAADLMYAINNEMNMTELSGSELANMSRFGNETDPEKVDLGDDDNVEFVVDGDSSYDEDDLDNITIATLREQKKKKSEEAIAKLVANSGKAKDFVRMRCVLCKVKFRKWNWAEIGSHYYRDHKRKPLVHCLCGFPIRSLTGLYKHVVIHTGDNYKKTNDEKTIKHETMDGLKVKDFINFKCATCSKLFSSWYRLNSHTLKAHKQPPVVQCRCGLIIKSKSCLYKHIADHKTLSTWSCDQCALVAKSEEALNKHKMRHVPKSERKYECPSCDKIFKTKDSLRSHSRIHIPVEQRQIFQCDQCEMKFTTRTSAATHKRVVHLKVKSYVCDLCGYACGTSSELRQHRAIHSDDKPFGCPKCSKTFKTCSNLTTHMDTHAETSYACYVCNRVLNSRRTLRKHLLVHEDKCRHICAYCNKAFKRRQTLKVHLYTHTGDKPLTCKWCGERFAYASSLRSHRVRCHPDKAPPPQPPPSTTDVYQLHLQQQDYKNNLTAPPGIDIIAEKNEVDAMS